MLLNNHVKQSPIIGLAGMGGGIASYVFLSAAGGYEIARSLKFEGSPSYLDKTFASAGSRTTWTWSAWIKRQNSGSEDVFTAASGGAGANCGIFFNSGDQLFLNLGDQLNSGSGLAIRTTQVFRDFSAWYHVVAVVDTTNGTQSDRLRLYVNGVRVTNLATTSYPGPSEAGGFINSGEVHNIGRRAEDGNLYFQGYLADVWFIDGQALDETSFGEFDADTGVWNPKRYTGTASGNSFHLPFSNNTSTTTLGYDDSGNSNNWTLNTFQISTGSYTSGISVGTYTLTDYDKNAVVDGRLSGTFYADRPINGNGLNFTSIPQASTSCRIYAQLESGTLTTNGGDIATGATNAQWLTVDTTYPFTLTSISASGGGASDGFFIFAIEIDGTILIDRIYDDSLVDSPSNDTDTGTGIGGEIVGNYATLNPLTRVGGNTGTSSATLSNGNLRSTNPGSSSWNVRVGTTLLQTGKWYYEYVVGRAPSAFLGGWCDPREVNYNDAVGNTARSYGYYTTGSARNSNSNTTFGDSYVSGDVIGCAIDLDNLKIYWSKNGTWQNSADPAAGTGSIYTIQDPVANNFYYTIAVSTYEPSSYVEINAGQRDFIYDAPTGFKAINTSALSPAIEVPSDYVGITTGNFDTTKTWVTGFQPDLIWFKSRTNTDGHMIQDSVRGVGSTGKYFFIGASAEGTFPVGGQHGVTTFNSDGWTHASYGPISNSSMVAWTWKAGGNSNTFNIDGTGYSTASAAGLDGGTITPTGASVNTESGFSILKLPGTASAASFSHGLGKTPSFIILKETNGTGDWQVGHRSLNSGWTSRMPGLNLTGKEETTTSAWNDTPPTDSLITVGATSNVDNDFIVYAWAEILGLQKFGNFVGRSGENYVELGFEPALVIIKNASNASYPTYTGWAMFDSERTPYNVVSNALFANKSQQENLRGNGDAVVVADFSLDLLSNGFCLRDNGASEINLSGNTYIYAAWAKHPQKYSRAR